MSTLTEIRAAAAQLKPHQQRALMRFLADRQSKPSKPTHRRLKAASYPPLDGLPADLSVNTRQKVKALITRKHATDR